MASWMFASASSTVSPSEIAPGTSMHCAVNPPSGWGSNETENLIVDVIQSAPM